MRRISSDIETRIFELWFAGYTRECVAKAVGKGESTVSDVIGTLPRCLQIARDIAVANRKHNTTLAEAWKGLEVYVELVAVGVTTEQIRSFIQAFRKMSADAGYEPSRVISAAMELSNLEAQSGKKYPEAIEEFRASFKEKEELDKGNEERRNESIQLQLEIDKNKQLRNETLEQAKTAPEELSEVHECKAAFRRYGMDINDAKTVRKVLDNIKEAGGDAKHVVSIVKKHDSIVRSLSQLEKQLPAKKDEFTNLQSHVQELRQVISELQIKKDQLQNFINSQRARSADYSYQQWLIQVNITELEKCREALITWIGKKLKLSPQEVLRLRLSTDYELIVETIDNLLIDNLISLQR